MSDGYKYYSQTSSGWTISTNPDAEPDKRWRAVHRKLGERYFADHDGVVKLMEEGLKRLHEQFKRSHGHKKSMPTLADTCVASALDKRVFPGSSEANKMVRETLLKVPRARKFMLDKQMSIFLAELQDGITQGGLRKRNVMLENARRMSRLPHPLTWVEFDYFEYFGRLLEMNYHVVGPRHEGKQPDKMGWLFEQHPYNESAFRMTSIWSSAMRDGVAFLHPTSMAWCADDQPSPWRRWPDAETSDLAVCQGYVSKQAHLMATFNAKVSAEMTDILLEGMSEDDAVNASLPPTSLRPAWALLSTINDLPIRFENVEPSKGYVSRGSYKKFLKHSIIHLDVPETKRRKLVLKSAALLRRRAHQVRGHWRKDWRRPLSVLCEHVFDEQMICRRCQGRQVWVHEHQRGDASLGFVTHDYEVHASADGARP